MFDPDRGDEFEIYGLLNFGGLNDMIYLEGRFLTSRV